jgi:Cu/Ag efflux pump CusA
MTRTNVVAVTFGVLVALAAGAFYLRSSSADTPPAASQPPATPVPVATVERREVTLWDEFSGRLEAVERVDVRSRVAGAIQSVHFAEGALPLAFSVGAGAEMRQAMGIAVFAGMIGVTAFGIFLTPLFYVLLRALSGNRPLKRHGEIPHDGEAFAGGGGVAPVLAAPIRKDVP